MLGVKILIYSSIFLVCSIIGLLKSQKYVYRVEELQEFKNALNMFKTKIKFTYEPIPDIFSQISGSINPSVGSIFKIASYNMKFFPAGDAWNRAVDTDILNISLEDKGALKNLSKLLGETDIDGQLSQIEVTTSFLDEQIKKAIEVAQGTEFVEKMDGQYDAHMAQGGTNVSGGQKQRLSIARAIARNPEIYIFDDSFSALDYKTDSVLRKELKKYTSDATSLIVAQRIGTIMNADQIVVLDNGVIVGKGTHKELLKTCEVYKQIALSQLSKEELENG